ncbi:MAG: DegT/DnrJ/EryC1/StrS family aminotransferase [Myxococcales bacterium]|nr:DegT/DnrJ/EryC1/StrS family aminotransferase [Myxococcales bacterium]
MRVPLLDLRAQYARIKPEIDAAIAAVVDSQHFILGPEVERLEHEIAAYCRTAHAVGCSSGSDALLLALMAVGVGPGDEVLCPTYTFFATAGAVHRLGARPVFVDAERATYNIDPESARAAARRCRRLKAILPVHLYGQCADMAAMEALGREFGVPIIEDAAQAIGAEDIQGRRAGSIGAVGCFSFFPSKNLGAFGDGGIATAEDPALAAAMKRLRVHGAEPKYHHQVVGFNGRLDALQAAVIRVKLRHLDTWTDERRQNAAVYDQAFEAAGAKSSAEPLGGSGLPLRYPRPAPEGARHIYNQYVIRVPAGRRDALRAHLTNQGVGTEIYYPIHLHLQECFASLGGAPGQAPEAESAARETIALPIYPELTETQLGHVARTTIAFLRD